VAYDVRGAGDSDAPTSRDGYAMAQLADDLFRVIDAVGKGRKVHLVAHDWGSIQSWEAVTDPRAPEVIATYTTISGPCLDHVGHALRAMPRQRPVGALKQAAKSWYIYAFHVPKLPELVWRTRLAQKVFGPSESLAKDGGNGVELYRANIRQHLMHPRERRTTVPVQLIVLTKDAFVSPALTADLELWASDVTRREIEASHWVVSSHPEVIANAIWSYAAAHPVAA
jgi:pimeloyl-ACP methyl ester carboxylesterase